MEFYALRGYVNRGEIRIIKVPTETNPADFFTKVLSGPKFHAFKRSIMQNHMSPTPNEQSPKDELVNAICTMACGIEV